MNTSFVKFCLNAMFLKRLLFITVLLYAHTGFGMLLKKLASKKTVIMPKQKRLFISPSGISKVSATISTKPELQKFDLVHGLALRESGSLANAYNISLDKSSDLVKLIKSMFHRVTPEGDLLVTKSVFKTATFMTPETMGILLGAIETGELKRGALEFNQSIMDTWYAHEEVQRKLSAEDGLEYGMKFKKEVDNFFSLITQLSYSNKSTLISVLLAFLYQKINHFSEEDEFHDWMHFLSSINEYISVFSASELEKIHKKLLTSGDYTAWFNSKLFNLKLNIVPYSSEQYARFLVKNLPLVVADIIESNVIESVYPAKIIMGEFGYKGQRKKGDCVETAVRDILLNLFYDAKKKSFSLFKYPQLSLDARLKEYIGLSNPENINTLMMGQRFMDLVSEREGFGYVEANYELFSSSDNILKVFNVLLGTAASSWPELGKQLTALSGNKIQVDCSLKKMGLKNKVSIAIIDTLDNTKKYLDLNIMRMHAYVSFPEREKFKSSRIDLKSLSQLPYINPLIRSLFYLVRDINIDVLESHKEEMKPLLYFSWPVRNDTERQRVIQKILSNYSEDKNAIQYAYTLFKSLDTHPIKLLRNSNLFREYCQDKDADFKNTTKAVVIAEIGLWHLKTLLQEMNIEKAQQFMSSFMSSKEFDNSLLNDHQLFEAILYEKHGDSVLSYLLKKKLLRADQFSIAQEIVIEKIMNALRNPDFITNFYAFEPRAFSELFVVVNKKAEDFYTKRNLCSLLLKQNIDHNNQRLYNEFYRGILPLYISLLQKNYSEYIQGLGDIRLRFKNNSELYDLYDKAMETLKQKAFIALE